MSLIRELLNRIEAEASGEIAPDFNADFNPNDWSGGNFDDAYEMGIEHGYVLFARELLDMINQNS